VLVEQQEGHLARKKYAGMVVVVLVSPDGVAPSRMVSVSASVNLPLHCKVQKFSSGTGSPGWSLKKGHKMFVVSEVSCMHICNRMRGKLLWPYVLQEARELQRC